MKFSTDQQYFIDVLEGVKNGYWAHWYNSTKKWTWRTSGTEFPADDANQTWDDPRWGQFILYIEVSRFIFYTYLN